MSNTQINQDAGDSNSEEEIMGHPSPNDPDLIPRHADPGEVMGMPVRAAGEPAPAAVLCSFPAIKSWAKRARIAAGLSQSELAESLECKPSAISNWEGAAKPRSTPCMEDLVRLAELAGWQVPLVRTLLRTQRGQWNLPPDVADVLSGMPTENLRDEMHVAAMHLSGGASLARRQRNAELFVRHFGFGERLADIARDMGVTRQRVDQIVGTMRAAAAHTQIPTECFERIRAAKRSRADDGTLAALLGEGVTLERAERYGKDFLGMELTPAVVSL
ncbi:MAG: hypothetical protein A2580_08950 [Hydrogenophilales bacterium RIFOXYD1_FULL_62_11]|nr:MAG: hypothetical protein A2580_08950 [Hydrogenophilales bacterium RIFOXYD1_FULL_62_11]